MFDLICLKYSDTLALYPTFPIFEQSEVSVFIDKAKGKPNTNKVLIPQWNLTDFNFICFTNTWKMY